jgi:hypothetical protein
MSRGLGTLQRRLLVSIAAIDTGHAGGADVFDLLRLWSQLDGQPREAYNRANLHRGLRTLEARGLIAYTDQADYTPRCQCFHEPVEHRDGVGWCQHAYPHRSRWCRCARYRPRPHPRPHWFLTLTPAGTPLVSAADKAPIVEQWQALQQERLAALARLETALK